MKTVVLVADDHAIIRDGLRRILADTADMEVGAEASDGHATLEKIREKDWGLVLLDLSMPGRSGLELIRLIRSWRPRTRILVFSMHPEEHYAVRAIRAGALGYLSKEADGDLLLPAMRTVAAGKPYVSARVAELLAAERRQVDSPLPHTLLTTREYGIFSRLVRGSSVSQIARELCVSIKTVSTHKTHVLEKMGLANQVELVRYAIDHGLLDISRE